MKFNKQTGRCNELAQELAGELSANFDLNGLTQYFLHGRWKELLSCEFNILYGASSKTSIYTKTGGWNKRSLAWKEAKALVVINTPGIAWGGYADSFKNRYIDSHWKL